MFLPLHTKTDNPKSYGNLSRDISTVIIAFSGLVVLRVDATQQLLPCYLFAAVKDLANLEDLSSVI